MGRHIAANGMTLLILALFVAGMALMWGKSEFSAPGPLVEDTVVEVPSGANLSVVTERLRTVGAISYGRVFSVAARMRGDDERLKRGCYTLDAGASMEQILDRITTGAGSEACYQATFVFNSRGIEVRISNAVAPEADDNGRFELEDGLARVGVQIETGEAVSLRVAVAEGLTTQEVLSRLDAVPYLDGPVGDAPPEGMLAPDTYDFRPGAERIDLVRRMRDLQERRLAEAWEARAPDSLLETPEELLTLASIVEKETGVPAERPVIAAVFLNRLQRSMRLQTDPTIVYGITRGAAPLGREITRSDIDGVTERRAHGEVLYNTYIIDGLPPGPIANPGRAALRAAATPEPTEYLFFVAKGDGSREHAFAETLEAHNRNVAAYRARQ